MHTLHAQYGNCGGAADWEKLPDIPLCTPALAAWMATRGDHELLVFDDDRVTYAEAERQSAVLALQLLGAGITKGTRVGFSFPNDSRFVATWLAITRIGAVAVPPSTLATPAEVAKTAAHAGISLFIYTDRYLNNDYVGRFAEAGVGQASRGPLWSAVPTLREIWVWGKDVPSWAKRVEIAAAAPRDRAALAAAEALVNPDTPMAINYTSGSTSEPKGIVHSHDNWLRQGAKLAATSPYRDDERVYTPMPFFWVGGISVLLNVLLVRGTVLGTTRQGALLLDFIENERVTHVSGWPHQMKILALDPTFAGRKFSALRSGALIEALPEHLRPRNPCSALGMTETSGQHTFNLRGVPDSLAGSAGQPMPGAQHRIIDAAGKDAPPGERGELIVKTDTMMLGMLGRDLKEVLDRDGWYHTKDLCSFREGLLFFHGRLDDLIKTAGANVSPREVEAALATLLGVAQAHVQGVADAERGQVVGAVIVALPGRTLSAEALRADAAKLMSSYKVPRVWVFVEADAVPITPSRKVDPAGIRKLLQSARAEAGAARR